MTIDKAARYRVVTIQNNWSVFGNRINVQETTTASTDDPIIAGKLYTAQDPKQWRAKNAVRIEVREFGLRIEAIELYAAAIGPEVFGKQLADESYSMNLDDWFAAQPMPSEKE